MSSGSSFAGSALVSGWSFLSSCALDGFSPSSVGAAGLVSGAALDEGSGLDGEGAGWLFFSFAFSSSFFSSAVFFFLDLDDLLLARELAKSDAVSMGKGAFGSTFRTSKKEARTVVPPGNHSSIVFSGNRYRSPEPACPDVLLPYGVKGDVNSRTTDL